MLVEVVVGVEGDVEFDVAGFGFEAEGLGLRAMTSGVGAFAETVGVLEEVDLRGLGGSKVDVVGGCDGVVGGGVFGAGGYKWSVSIRDSL